MGELTETNQWLYHVICFYNLFWWCNANSFLNLQLVSSLTWSTNSVPNLVRYNLSLNFFHKNRFLNDICGEVQWLKPFLVLGLPHQTVLETIEAMLQDLRTT